MSELAVSAPDCASLFLRTIPNVMRRIGEATRQQSHCREWSLNMGQVHIMACLSNRQSSLRELAANQHVTSSTMSRTVEVLVERGWLNRTSDPSDRRQIMLELTSEGKAALAEFRELTQEVMARILDLLSAEERGALYRGLEALAALRSLQDGDPPVARTGETERFASERSRRHPEDVSLLQG